MDGWGSRGLNFLVKKTMSCLYGILDHAKHIIFQRFLKNGKFSENFYTVGVGGWVGGIRCLGNFPKKYVFFKRLP